jgi:hypothetical protein
MKINAKQAGTSPVLRPHVLRLLYLGFILSFLLPYVDVKGCSTKKVQLLHGYDLLANDQGSFYYMTIGIFAVFLIFSFMNGKHSKSIRAFASGWRSLGAGFSSLAVLFMPRLQFLFDEVTYRTGLFLGLACAVAAFVDGCIASIRGLAVLRRSGPHDLREGIFPALLRYHYAVMIVSVLMIPAYFYLMKNDIMLAVLILFLLSLPFAITQYLVLEGVKRGEAWTRVWAVVVSFIVAAAFALIIMGFI